VFVGVLVAVLVGVPPATNHDAAARSDDRNPIIPANGSDETMPLKARPIPDNTKAPSANDEKRARLESGLCMGQAPIRLLSEIWAMKDHPIAMR
jgi:hypothetical protein